jgi:murein tripeptide amidase MpaA
MINVDGVVMGNARSSLVGLDLNRRWTDPNPLLHPEVYFLKETMKSAVDLYEKIAIFCDLHGHNK